MLSVVAFDVRCSIADAGGYTVLGYVEEAASPPSETEVVFKEMFVFLVSAGEASALYWNYTTLDHTTSETRRILLSEVSSLLCQSFRCVCFAVFVCVVAVFGRLLTCSWARTAKSSNTKRRCNIHKNGNGQSSLNPHPTRALLIVCLFICYAVVFPFVRVFVSWRW